MKVRNTFLALIFLGALHSANGQNAEVVLVKNAGGQTLGYSPISGIKILTINGLSFKDLNRNGQLDRYEDWRLPADARARDLASKLSIEQIAGLMLYSRHQSIPARSTGYFAGTYQGKLFPESGAKPEALTDQQMAFLSKDNLRHVLVTTVQSPEAAALWNNNVGRSIGEYHRGRPNARELITSDCLRAVFDGRLITHRSFFDPGGLDGGTSSPGI